MRTTWACALSVLVLGCIPKGKYEVLLADQEMLYVRIDAMNASMSDVGKELSELKSDMAMSSTALDESNRMLASKITEAGQLQESVTDMQAALRELEERRARAEANMDAYRDLVARFQAMIDAGTLEVKVVDGRMLVQLATDILFPPGSARLSKEGRAAIERVAAVLSDIPEREYQVAGHTDDVPIATDRFPSNWHLGAARAIAVARLLVDSGLRPERVSAASHAEHRPIDTNRTVEGKAANRRIEIAVLPDLSSLPGFEELRAVEEGSEDKDNAG